MSVKLLIILILLLSNAVYAQRDFDLESQFNKELSAEERAKVKDKIFEFSQQINQDSENYIHYYNRGVMYGRLGLHNDAISDYNKALKLKEDFPQGYYNRGMSRARFGYTKTSCTDIKKSAELGFSPAVTLYKSKCGLYSEELGELP